MTRLSRSNLRGAKATVSRRRFLTLTAGTLALAACAPVAAPTEPEATPEPEAPEEPTPAVEAIEENEVEVIVGDVLDYELTNDDWPGAFGRVQFRLHEGLVDGESVYFIRTDGSDPNVAQTEGLVYVPLLNTAAGMDDVHPMYLFDDGRPPVFTWLPGHDLFSSLFHCITVDVHDDSAELTSAQAILDAAEAGAVSLTPQSVYVNYPFIQWPGGSLPTDSVLEEYLGDGQLFIEPDLNNMTVDMKLHQCFPGSRYILTDTGAAPMAPMMGVIGSPPTQQLAELGGTDEIWVFGNGIEGPGVMGFQPAIFDNRAGQPAWSPFWDHFTVTWADPEAATMIRDSAEIRELIESGDLEEWAGTPDTHPDGFVVNCPVPILAPNTF